MLAHCDIILQVLFMHAAQGAQKIAHGSPTAFARVGVDFVNAIAVIITRPFVLGVTHRRMGARQVVVTAPFVGVTRRRCLRRCRDVLLQRQFVRMRDHCQADLPAGSSERPDDRRAIIVIRAVAFALICVPARRIGRVAMRITFFPPRSETSRRFPSRHPAAAFAHGLHTHWLASARALARPSCD